MPLPQPSNRGGECGDAGYAGDCEGDSGIEEPDQ